MCNELWIERLRRESGGCGWDRTVGAGQQQQQQQHGLVGRLQQRWADVTFSNPHLIRIRLHGTHFKTESCRDFTDFMTIFRI